MVPLVVGLLLLALSAEVFRRRSAGVTWARAAVIAFTTLNAGLLLCVLWITAAQVGLTD